MSKWVIIMDLKINYQEVSRSSNGFYAYSFFTNSNKPTYEIIFTKGKMELEKETVERIAFNENSMLITYKDKTMQFINLENVTQII